MNYEQTAEYWRIKYELLVKDIRPTAERIAQIDQIARAILDFSVATPYTLTEVTEMYLTLWRKAHNL